MSPAPDLSRYQDPLTIQRVIHTARTIAIVGLSKNELRASYFVGFYLRRHGSHRGCREMRARADGGADDDAEGQDARWVLRHRLHGVCAGPSGGL